MSASKGTILYIGAFELPDKNGAAHRVVANAKILRTLGYQVAFLGVNKSLDRDAHVLETEAECYGFRSWAIPYPRTKKEWIGNIFHAQGLKSVLKTHFPQGLAAVVCYNYPALAQIHVRLLCRQYSAKHVADVTEWYESSGGGILFGLVKWFDTTLRMRVIHRLVDGLITTSRVMTEFYGRTARYPIVELPTLYDRSQLPLCGRPMIGGHLAPCRFIYAGSPFNIKRLDKNRENIKDRLDVVVLAVAELLARGGHIVLDVYGVTMEEYLVAFPEQEDFLLMHSEAIFFHGQRPHAEVLSATLRSDFSIFFRKSTRLTEAGFPSKLSESLSCGVPVITNSLKNLEPFAGKVPGLCIVPMESSGVNIDAMQVLISSKDSIREACQECDDFDYRSYASRVESFVRELGIVSDGAPVVSFD